MSERQNKVRWGLLIGLIALIAVMYMATRSGGESRTRRSSSSNTYSTPTGFSNSDSCTADTSHLRSDTRYGDFYFVRRTNMEIMVNCKSGQVLVCDLTTKKVADATGLANSLNVEFDEVCR